MLNLYATAMTPRPTRFIWILSLPCTVFYRRADFVLSGPPFVKIEQSLSACQTATLRVNLARRATSTYEAFTRLAETRLAQNTLNYLSIAWISLTSLHFLGTPLVPLSPRPPHSEGPLRRARPYAAVSLPSAGPLFSGSHLSYTTCLTHFFFKSGE